VIIGIDPGINGAIAVINKNNIYLYDIDGSLIDAINTLKEYADADGVVIEKVASMPKQGVSSTFNFGCTYGHLRGACIALGIPIIAEPTPVVWKRKIFGAGIFGKDRSGQKTAARDKARELYPSISGELKRVKDSDRAEALLLAEFGRRSK